jgi:hypothetical protein
MAIIRRDIRCVAVLVLSLLLTGAAAPPGKAQWQEDLRYFAKELAKRHKNLYHATSKEQFERAVAELDASIPSLQDHQVVSYSTKYYKFLDEDAPAVLPDQRIDPNWPDWLAGRDPVMDWILGVTRADG